MKRTRDDWEGSASFDNARVPDDEGSRNGDFTEDSTRSTQKKRRVAKNCKCGSSQHVRITHRTCPLNPGNAPVPGNLAKPGDFQEIQVPAYQGYPRGYPMVPYLPSQPSAGMGMGMGMGMGVNAGLGLGMRLPSRPMSQDFSPSQQQKSYRGLSLLSTFLDHATSQPSHQEYESMHWVQKPINISADAARRQVLPRRPKTPGTRLDPRGQQEAGWNERQDAESMMNIPRR